MTRAQCSRLVVGFATICLGVATLANCGCLLVAAGTAAGALAGAAYVNGNVSATYFAYPNDVWVATLKGLNELGMPVKKEKFDGFKGSLESCTADGDKVSMTLEDMSPPGLVGGAMTRLSVRIASFGDRNASVKIFRQIGGHIPAPTLPPPASVATMPGGVGPVGTSTAAASRPLTATNLLIPPVGGNPLVIQNQEPPRANAPIAEATLQAPAAEPPFAPQIPAPSSSIDAAPKIPQLPLTPTPVEPPRGPGA
jgi:hypothetical protein